MLKNYFKTTTRNLLRNRGNTFINVFGLSLGITCSLILFLLIAFFLSFDRHHENFDRIYRVVTSSKNQDGNRVYSNGVPSPMADAVRADIPGIEKLVFVSNKYTNSHIGIHEDEAAQSRYFEEREGVAFTEPTYFDVFTRELVQGQASGLSRPGTVILSEKLAHKYFGRTDIIGREIKLDKKHLLEVAGIMEDAPRNSDFPFNMLISYATIKDDYEVHGWGSVSSDDQIYLVAGNSVTPQQIDENLIAFREKYQPDDDQDRRYFLQPLADLHFDTRFSNYRYVTISQGNILTMGLVALFILATACINFVNISTAVAVKRAKEVGIRKVLGGTRSQLIRQFLGETLMVVLLSVVVALGMAELLLIYINPFLDVNLSIDWFSDGKTELFLAATVLVVTLLAGVWPSMVLARLTPAAVLKSKWSGARASGFSLRKLLVGLQFVITPFFIIGTLVLVAQRKFLTESDLGFGTDAVVVIELSDREVPRKKTLKESIEKLSGVQHVSLASTTPLSGSISVTDVQIDGDPNDYYVDIKWSDENYLEVYNIDLAAGKSLPAIDTMNSAVVNEEFLRKAGIDNPQDAVGRMLHIWGSDVPVIGVVSNFYSRNLRMKLEPLMFINGIGNTRTMSVKLAGGNLKQHLAAIEKEWKSVYPEYTFEYEFADDVIAIMYESEQQMATIFTFFSCIAIFLGCLGLFGLVSFTVNQKVKEIGIRKVLGASVHSILKVISSDFLKPVLAGFIIAVPLGYFLMSMWLENYQYRISLGFDFFLIALAATLLIAVITTGYKTLSAASANPVDSLRDE